VKVHREGRSSIAWVILFTSLTGTATWLVPGSLGMKSFISLVLVSCLAFIYRFFRDPNRTIRKSQTKVLCPADGHIIAIKQEYENEYFKKEKTKVSIFMSGYDVHINWTPIDGILIYLKYFPGKHLLAKYPKSSLLNERTSAVIEGSDGKQILVRQIAGVMARRVVNYWHTGDTLEQGSEFGFIKFGSRIELFLPTNSKVLVNIGDRVIGRQTMIAELI